MEKEKQWLFHLLPNLKHLSLYSIRLPSPTTELVPIMTKKIQRLDIDQTLIRDLANANYVYFPNLQHLVINSSYKDYLNTDRILITLVKELLSNMKTLKTSLSSSSPFDQARGSILGMPVKI